MFRHAWAELRTIASARKGDILVFGKDRAILGANDARYGGLAKGCESNTQYIADEASGLAIVDVSIPSNPRMIRSVDVQGTTKGVDVTDTRTHAVVAVGSPSVSAVKIIDITDETNPQVVGSVPIPGDAKDLVVRDTYAYVAAYTGGLQIVDIRTPSNPRIVGAIPQSGGFVPRDVALSGQFALAAEQLFPNAIPIVEISDPTDPIFLSTIDLSSLGDYAGTGIALTQQFAYVTAERFVVSQDFNATGDTRLFIAQYLAIEDNEGIPPTVSLTSPAPGDDVIEGSTIQITANATDDIAVAVVNFLVDGAIVSTDASAPYQTTIVVPVGVTSLTLGATAIDFGSNSGTAAAVRVDVIPDPLTTVVGLVIDPNGLPVAGASVQTVHGLSDTTAADGSFSIPDVPTILGHIIVSASATIADEQFRGRSSPVPPVPAGITDVGSIIRVVPQ